MPDILFSTKSIDDTRKETIQNSLESIYESLIFFTSPSFYNFVRSVHISLLGQLNEFYKIINGRTCQNNLPAVYAFLKVS